MEDYELNNQALFFTMYDDQCVKITNNYGNWTEVGLEDLFQMFSQRLAEEAAQSTLKLMREGGE